MKEGRKEDKREKSTKKEKERRIKSKTEREREREVETQNYQPLRLPAQAPAAAVQEAALGRMCLTQILQSLQLSLAVDRNSKDCCAWATAGFASLHCKWRVEASWLSSPLITYPLNLKLQGFAWDRGLASQAKKNRAFGGRRDPPCST